MGVNTERPVLWTLRNLRCTMTRLRCGTLKAMSTSCRRGRTSKRGHRGMLLCGTWTLCLSRAAGMVLVCLMHKLWQDKPPHISILFLRVISHRTFFNFEKSNIISRHACRAIRFFRNQSSLPRRARLSGAIPPRGIRMLPNPRRQSAFQDERCLS